MILRRLLHALVLIALSAGLAQADLNSYLKDLDDLAHRDMNHFKAELGARFGLSGGELEVVFRTVDGAAEAAVVLWLGERSRQRLDTVLTSYRAQKGQGWGAVAKSLGIKPGSAEFHALKQGNLGWYPGGDAGAGKGKGNGKGKGKEKK